MLKNNLFLIFLYSLIVISQSPAIANDSLVYTKPPTNEYFHAPAGKGILKICVREGYHAPSHIHIPMGTIFSDVGSTKSYDAGNPQWWLLNLVTTQSGEIKNGGCVSVTARVTKAEKPPAHKELQSVMRFERSDNRDFEPVDVSDDLINLHAVAETDFN